ncbi:hypothetical protein [Sorangium sp. So ce341]|uniref:hypothetical protein n=1 Tax=Sorangium sp. So ce341 TaxID=3133302 RepID=UPI003F646F4D
MISRTGWLRGDVFAPDGSEHVAMDRSHQDAQRRRQPQRILCAAIGGLYTTVMRRLVTTDRATVG